MIDAMNRAIKQSVLEALANARETLGEGDFRLMMPERGGREWERYSRTYHWDLLAYFWESEPEVREALITWLRIPN